MLREAIIGTELAAGLQKLDSTQRIDEALNAQWLKSTHFDELRKILIREVLEYELTEVGNILDELLKKVNDIKENEKSKLSKELSSMFQIPSNFEGLLEHLVFPSLFSKHMGIIDALHKELERDIEAEQDINIRKMQAN